MADSENFSAFQSAKGSAKGTKRSIEEQERARRAAAEPKPAPKRIGSPRWWAPLMVALMIVGLLIVVLAYVFGGNLPIPGWGNYNLFLGIGLMLVGMLMTMGWK